MRNRLHSLQFGPTPRISRNTDASTVSRLQWQPVRPLIRVSLTGALLPSQHEPVELKEGVEVRFGASTRAFFLRREGATGSARKRGVQWPDEDAGKPSHLPLAQHTLRERAAAMTTLGPQLVLQLH